MDKSKNLLHIMFFASLLVSYSCQAVWFGPSNYNECVRDSTKDARTNYIAAQAIRACKRQFETEIPESQLDLIKINDGHVKFNGAELEINNQSNVYTLTRLSVRISLKPEFALHPGVQPVTYSFDTFVPPQSSKVVDADGGDYLWKNFNRGYQLDTETKVEGSGGPLVISPDVYSEVVNGDPLSKFDVQIINAFGVPQQ